MFCLFFIDLSTCFTSLFRHVFFMLFVRLCFRISSLFDFLLFERHAFCRILQASPQCLHSLASYSFFLLWRGVISDLYRSSQTSPSKYLFVRKIRLRADVLHMQSLRRRRSGTHGGRKTGLACDEYGDQAPSGGSQDARGHDGEHRQRDVTKERDELEITCRLVSVVPSLVSPRSGRQNLHKQRRG